MIDYPKRGYDNRQAFLKQVLHRLDTEIESKDLQELASLYNQRNAYMLFPDATPAVLKAKQLGLKTAIVTTIPEFVFHSAIEPIESYVDVIMTGHRAGCEKSNPLMHKKALEELHVVPAQAVMIGDELLVDMKIPKKLGMHTILLDRKGTIRNELKEADDKTSTLAEAMFRVEKWQET
jgi:FMN phosphatase YigB (HAD superfamily)